MLRKLALKAGKLPEADSAAAAALTAGLGFAPDGIEASLAAEAEVPADVACCS